VLRCGGEDTECAVNLTHFGLVTFEAAATAAATFMLAVTTTWGPGAIGALGFGGSTRVCVGLLETLPTGARADATGVQPGLADGAAGL